MSEFKEFTLSVKFDGCIPRLFFNKFVHTNTFKPEEQLHVIEYAAYSKLKEENEFLRDAFKREITKLNDINASDFDKYEREITDLKQEIDRLNNYTISGLEIMLAELKHDHKIMLDALESLSTGLAFAQGFISVHSTEAELFVTKQYENYKEAISQLKHKENI